MFDPKAIDPKALLSEAMGSQSMGSQTAGSKAMVPQSEPVALTQSPLRPRDSQRSLMIAALVLLLVGLGVSLYQYRDFWFPDTEEAESDQPAEIPATVPAQAATPQKATSIATRHHAVASAKTGNAKVAAEKIGAEKTDGERTSTTAAAPLAATATTTRTVLPPLEVEVVAGDSHRTIRPGNNSLRVDLQPGTTAHPDAAGNTETAANVTSNAAERVQISSGTADVVSRPVRPDYPLLARQMKVQGSVILQALISKDGTIQDLRVVSGPPILAAAAEDAVRQWHFKPHYLGAQAVETQAKITVNFTISTN